MELDPYYYYYCTILPFSVRITTPTYCSYSMCIA